MSSFVKKYTSVLLAASLMLPLSACSEDRSPVPSDVPPAAGTGEDRETPDTSPEPTGVKEPAYVPEPEDAGDGACPDDPVKEPESSANDILVSAFEETLARLRSIPTAAGALPDAFTASGTLLYVDDEGVPHPETASPISIVYGPDMVALSAPELLGYGGYFTLPRSGIDRFSRLVSEFLCSLELVPSPGGETFEDSVSSERMAGFLRSLLELEPAIPLAYAAISGDRRALDVSDALEGAFASGEEVKLRFELRDGMLARVNISGPLTAEISVDGHILTVNVAPLGVVSLTLGDVIALEGFLNYGDGTTVSLSWSAGGSLSYIHSSTDITGLSVEGEFDFSGENPVFTGFAATGNRGDRTEVSLTFTPGASLPEGSMALSALPLLKLGLAWTKLKQGGGK